MKKFFIGLIITLSILFTIFLMWFCPIIREAEQKTYKYIETIARVDTVNNVTDTLRYMYPIHAHNDEEAYVKAFDMYLANMYYINYIVPRGRKSDSNNISLKIVDFIITDRNGVELIKTPSIRRKIELRFVSEIFNSNIIYNHEFGNK